MTRDRLPSSTFEIAAASAPTTVLVVVGLALGPAVALGFARFSYALLLPAMREDMHWTYAAAGFSNTANAIGYFLGAIIAAPVAARVGDKCAFAIGLAITVAALLGSGFSDDFLLMAGLRAIAGAAGALPFITGAALAAAAGGGGDATRPARMLGIYFGGGGFGMLVAALLVPEIIRLHGWRDGWLAMGALGLLGLAAAWPALLFAPTPPRHLSASGGRTPPKSARRLLPLLVSYTLFGAGYIAYATFIIAWLRTNLDFGPTQVAVFWACVAAPAAVAGLAWGPILTRLRAARGVALANAVVMVGAVLPVFGFGRPAAYASALLFGGSFLIVPTSVTAVARSATPPGAWTPVIALLTVGFAAGQCVGPLLIGWFSDSQSLSGGLLLSGGFLGLAALMALAQRPPEPQSHDRGGD
jgi:predicted MFS family arabinose efflux permease